MEQKGINLKVGLTNWQNVATPTEYINLKNLPCIEK